MAERSQHESAVDVELMSSYFQLDEECVIVGGAKRGALYKLDTGDVYSIDPFARKVLQECEARRSIREVFREVPEAEPGQILGFLRQAAEAGLGEFKDEPFRQPKQVAPHRCETLDFIWLELREDCNLRCMHCYAASEVGRAIANRLSIDEWKRILEEANGLGCRNMQFIGGEPFLFGPMIFDLSEHAKGLGYQSMEIFSNLTFLKNEWVDSLVRLDLSVACSLYSKRPEIHDQITGVAGSFERTIGNIRRLLERGIRPRVCTTVTRHNEAYVQETMEFLSELGIKNFGYDAVRPAGRGGDRSLVPKKLVVREIHRTQPEFAEVDRTTFVRNLSGNSCWQGKLVIASTGDVFPCIMQRDSPCGNVRSCSLREIVLRNIRRYWDLSFDHIEVCRDCEYRYACYDCRPIAYGLTGRITGKSEYCRYDPYAGEYAEGATGGAEGEVGACPYVSVPPPPS